MVISQKYPSATQYYKKMTEYLTETSTVNNPTDSNIQVTRQRTTGQHKRQRQVGVAQRKHGCTGSQYSHGGTDSQLTAYNPANTETVSADGQILEKCKLDEIDIFRMHGIRNTPQTQKQTYRPTKYTDQQSVHQTTNNNNKRTYQYQITIK